MLTPGPICGGAWHTRTRLRSRYELSGNRIRYWHDTGFILDGNFINDIFHHAGMIFYRRR
ncbi:MULTISPECIES: Atu4866 domain-containing protein [Brucella/Ochrobactrum group]|uniref:Atu4866 domain-containing protein n=1 Tax=Brucella/Ochrobactrum group TaxID=2826938 RepID=UPI001F2BE484|nr:MULTISPECIES: Atu4866 domain-containing protein [Brucella]WHS30427.1 Atu4866 domain-containing protein [Brucella sp. NM4]WHT45229.1 Atu4866 domain-containing protein [Ochrobactrum sp. SSR]